MLRSDQLDLQRALERIPALQLERAKSTGAKIPVGQETREGWSGYFEFYVFWCAACEAFSKDYAHSWPERQYVTCQHCEGNIRWGTCTPRPKGEGTVLVLNRKTGEVLLASSSEEAPALMNANAAKPVMNPRAAGSGVAGGIIVLALTVAIVFGGGKLAGFW